VPAEAYHLSIHGQLGYACVQCHTGVGNYPQPNFDASFPREATLMLNGACKRCHISEYERAQDSVHAVFLAGGNLNAAVCTDCHTAHDVRQLRDPDSGELLPDARAWIPTTCARCHSEIYEKYKNSVHGSALTDEGNPDVPTCIDCHGVHNIEDPTTTYFRLRSPQMCAKCHTDPAIAGKYGMSTDVLDTYVADFHGTTVVLFEKQSPDAETNKPVCYDCHGIHDIVRTDDPQKGLRVRDNLLQRCQVCHPDATESFPTSWTSHYIPSVDKNPLIYYVNLFYKFLIPGVLGAMGLLVVMDFSRANINRYRTWKRRQEEHERHETDEKREPVAEPVVIEETPPKEMDESDKTVTEPEPDAEIEMAQEAEKPEVSQEVETAEEQELIEEREESGAVMPDESTETGTTEENEAEAPDTETE
jgi:hypothetical protein